MVFVALPLNLNLPLDVKEATPKEYRFSVHPAPRLKTTCIIKHTAIYQDEQHPDYDSRVYVQTVDGRLCWPIYSEMCRYPQDNAKILDDNKIKDAGFYMGSYDPNVTSMACWVFALQNVEKVAWPQNFQGEILEFGSMSLLVVWTYFDSFSLPLGTYNVLNNTSHRLGGVGGKILNVPVNVESSSLDPLEENPSNNLMGSVAGICEYMRLEHCRIFFEKTLSIWQPKPPPDGLPAVQWFQEHCFTHMDEPRREAFSDFPRDAIDQDAIEQRMTNSGSKK